MWKVPKFFTNGMDCFGTGLGMFFHLYKGLHVRHEVFDKIEKNRSKIIVFSPILSKGPPQAKISYFQVFCFIFSKTSFVTCEPL